MPTYSFGSRRRRWTITSTPLVTPLQYAPNAATTVLPLRYRPRVAARPAITVRTPVLTTSPTGVNPPVTIFVPRARMRATQVVSIHSNIVTHTPITSGGYMPAQPIVRVPRRINRPVTPIFVYQTFRVAGVHSQTAPIVITRAAARARIAARSQIIRPLASQPATAIQRVVVARVPVRLAPKARPTAIGNPVLPAVLYPTPTHVVRFTPGRKPIIRAIGLVMPTGGIRPPLPTASRVVRTSPRPRVALSIVKAVPFVANAKPSNSTVHRSRIVTPIRKPVRPIFLSQAITSLGTQPPNAPSLLRITPRLVRPVQSITIRGLYTSPTLSTPSFRPIVVAPGRYARRLPPRGAFGYSDFPVVSLPNDLIAASIAWLRRYPDVVAAFGDSATTLKFTSDYIGGQPNYPIAVFSEPDEQQRRESPDEQGRIAIVTEGSYIVEVTATTKVGCRNLADLIGNTLTDADLFWQGGALMYLRQSTRRFPVTTEIGAPNSPALFRRPVEFLYIFESYEQT